MLKVIALVLFFMVPSAFAGEDFFLFTEDRDQYLTEKIYEGIEPSKEIENDSFLQAPMTRLDYMLTNLEKKMNELMFMFVDEPGKNFEKSEYSHVTPRISMRARFDERAGRVFLIVSFSELAKPKNSLTNFCRKQVKALEMFFEFGLGSWKHRIWGAYALGVLNREDVDFYQEPIRKIMRNFSLGATLDGLYTENGKNYHYKINCFKPSKDGELLFMGYSRRY